MATARYGGYLRASLPPFWPTTDTAAVRAALTRLRTAQEDRQRAGTASATKPSSAPEASIG
jgi:hypothetical protein